MSDTPRTDEAFAQLEETCIWVCEFAGMLNESRMLDDVNDAKKAMQKLERENQRLKKQLQESSDTPRTDEAEKKSDRSAAEYNHSYGFDYIGGLEIFALDG